MTTPKPTPARDRPAPRPGDPYLELARKTKFTDYFAQEPRREDPLQISVEFAPNATRPTIGGLALRPAHLDSRFTTGTATLQAIDALDAEPSVLRVLLAQPVLPQRARPHLSKPAPVIAPYTSKQVVPTKKPDEQRVLLAALDDACPFAHPFLRNEDGSTRIVRLWDQNATQADDPGELVHAGRIPPGFAYGWEFTQSDLDSIMKTNQWPDRRVDAASCYGAMRDMFLTRRASHGAHGVGLLAGDRLFDGRPASHRPVMTCDIDDLAARSDLVFVKFPTALMDCVSTASLEQHAYDGLRYILDAGCSLDYTRIVVSFAYESWLGPHDGSSWFEAAVDDLCDIAKNKGVDLQIVMAAGNARKRGVHARIEQPHKGFDLRIAVPPDNEVPTFVELWSPGDDTELDVSLIGPDGRQVRVQERDHVEALALRRGARGRFPEASLIVQRTPPAGSTLAPILVRIGPTYVTEDRQNTADHGIWTIRVAACDAMVGPLHAYIGRAVADGDSPVRGRQSRFLGLTPEQALADESGTLNGHACGKLPTVVGACHDGTFPYAASPFGPLHLHSCDYSGAAPGTGPSSTRRQALDVSVAADDSILRPGMLSIGAATGTVARFIGTSVATPAFARLLANGTHVATLPRSVKSAQDAALGVHLATIRPPLPPFAGTGSAPQLGTLLNSASNAASRSCIGRTKKRR